MPKTGELLIRVHSAYDPEAPAFELRGEPDQLRRQLRLRFPWLARYASESLAADVSRLNEHQNYHASLEG